MGRKRKPVEVGEVFGRLTAIGPSDIVKSHWSMFCRCACGKELYVACSNLRNGQTSCGCEKVKSKYCNLAGKRFGSLTVINETKERGIKFAECLCDCGTRKTVRVHHLVDGKTKSCGCLVKNRNIEIFTKHGEAKRGKLAREYRIWRGILRRCNDKTIKAYPNYGGRGISVCHRWTKYENFVEDMGRSPSPKHSIDRIDTNGNYEPKNCRWADNYEQARNKQNTLTAFYKGECKPLKVWASELGVNYYSLRNRIKNLGWSVEKSLEEPFKIGRNQFSD